MVRSGSRAGRWKADNGDTLIEVLIALLVLGMAGVALISAFTTVIGASSEHRTLSTEDVVLKDFAESVTYQLQLQQPTPLFLPCASLSGTATTSSPTMSYSNGATSQAISFTPPINYSVQVTQTQYLYNNTTFQSMSTGCDSSQYWPQLITATATGPKGTASLSFVVADPAKTESYVQPPSSTTTSTTTTTTTTIPTKIHVSVMSGSHDGTTKTAWDALVTITVDDASGSPVSGVVVSGSWSSSVNAFSSSCSTAASGSCQVQDGVLLQLGAADKSETFTVSSLVLTGDSYDPTANFASPASATASQP
jgi:type II secretory pathway pseudopilin PulG